jgi:2-furoyl-CoA dehydrogenase large subunit
MADEQTGRRLARFEDGMLLTGRGGFADDLPVAAGTLHAAILRSPHDPTLMPAVSSS